MGDIQELKDLVAQQVRKAAQAQKRNEDTQKRVDDLLAEIAKMRVEPASAGPGHTHAPDPVAIAAAALAARADKISKLGIALRKSYKVKNHDVHGFSMWS